MQDAVLNLCRVKLPIRAARPRRLPGRVPAVSERNVLQCGAARRLTQAAAGSRAGYSSVRAGNRSNALHAIFTDPGTNWVADLPRPSGKPQWRTTPAYATARARQAKLFDIFAEIEKFAGRQDQVRGGDILSKSGVPCAPVLSMKKSPNDPALRASGTVVEVEEKKRGTYLPVGSPIKFSASPRRSTGARCWVSTPTRC